MSRKKRQRRAALKRRARKLERLFPVECQRWNARIQFSPLPTRLPDTYLYHPARSVIILSDKLTRHQAIRATARQFAKLVENHGTPERSRDTFERLKANQASLKAWAEGGPRPTWFGKPTP